MRLHFAVVVEKRCQDYMADMLYLFASYAWQTVDVAGRMRRFGRHVGRVARLSVVVLRQI